MTFEFLVRSRFSLVVLLAGALIGLAGCGGTALKPGPTLFYPPLPQAPKIQFLARFQTSADIGTESGGFRKFVTGEEESVIDLRKPHFATLWQGKIYVCDSRRGEVIVLDLAAKKASILGAKQGFRFGKPLALVVDETGHKYIADNVTKRIFVFNDKDQYQREIGDEGQFGPTSLALVGNKLYIADALDKEVEIVDRVTGETLHKIKKFALAPGEDEVELLMPINLTVDDNGWLYVSDMIASVVRVFDENYEYVKTIGRPGDQLGTFGRPRGLAVDRQGFTYVADASFENVQVFSDTGEPVIFFGGPGTEPGQMYLPAGVTIAYEGLGVLQPYVDERFVLEYAILVTNQFAPNGVSVYGFGHAKDGVVPDSAAAQ